MILFLALHVDVKINRLVLRNFAKFSRCSPDHLAPLVVDVIDAHVGAVFLTEPHSIIERLSSHCLPLSVTLVNSRFCHHFPTTGKSPG